MKSDSLLSSIAIKNVETLLGAVVQNPLIMFSIISADVVFHLTDLGGSRVSRICQNITLLLI